MGAQAPRRNERTTILVAGAILAAACGAFAGVVYFDFPNATAAIAIDDVGKAVAALVAAGCCLWATTQTSGRVRVAWTLLGLSALASGMGQAVRTVYEVGFGSP